MGVQLRQFTFLCKALSLTSSWVFSFFFEVSSFLVSFDFVLSLSFYQTPHQAKVVQMRIFIPIFFLTFVNYHALQSFCLQFFDVSTVDVQERLVWSLTPRPSSTADFVRKRIRPNPDLYGPFWVCVTLIFSVAISGNVASYLQVRH